MPPQRSGSSQPTRGLGVFTGFVVPSSLPNFTMSSVPFLGVVFCLLRSILRWERPQVAARALAPGPRPTAHGPGWASAPPSSPWVQKPASVSEDSLSLSLPSQKAPRTPCRTLATSAAMGATPTRPVGRAPGRSSPASAPSAFEETDASATVQPRLWRGRRGSAGDASAPCNPDCAGGARLRDEHWWHGL